MSAMSSAYLCAGGWFVPGSARKLIRMLHPHLMCLLESCGNPCVRGEEAGLTVAKPCPLTLFASSCGSVITRAVGSGSMGRPRLGRAMGGSPVVAVVQRHG